MSQRRKTAAPFLFRHVEDVPEDENGHATYQRETIKNEGQ